MATTWPPTPPADESPELAALRAQFVRESPLATLEALVQSSVKFAHQQGFEGGRVVVVGSSLHAGLFVDACSALRLKDVPEKDVDEARLAIAAAKEAEAARDQALAKLPPEVAEKLKAEAGAAEAVAVAAAEVLGKS